MNPCLLESSSPPRHHVPEPAAAMGKMQDILSNVLPDAWAASMEHESRGWLMRCPCGVETSVWDMGGVRWKATGSPTRSGRCGACGRVFMGQLYQRDTVQAQSAPVATPEVTNAPPRPNDRGQWLLWIDGVGCWLVCTKDRLTIGGPSSTSVRDGGADLKLLADLSRIHAAIERRGEAYWLSSDVDAFIGEQRATQPSLLQDQASIRLGAAVQLQFRQPNPLSLSSRLEFVSGHRPAKRIDGIILMEQTCLIGPTSDCHIVCDDWEQTVILFRRDGKVWCKAGRQNGDTAQNGRDAAQLFVNGCQVDGDAAIRDGAVVTGHELRFRVEFAHADLG